MRLIMCSFGFWVKKKRNRPFLMNRQFTSGTNVKHLKVNINYRFIGHLHRINSIFNFKVQEVKLNSADSSLSFYHFNISKSD